jgi:SAM-dependent methyltransferase
MNTSVNHWPETKCAKAFWGQYELPPYQELLRDTTAWLQPGHGEHWLDLGCGSGQLSRALWQRSQGQVAEIVGVDCAAANERAYARLRESLMPLPRPSQLRFVAADFSQGFPTWPSGHFDGVVSGLALQYAESYSEGDGRWTQTGYDALLAEVWRLLKPAGTFVFSVNVPEPAWGRVALTSLGGVVKHRKPLRYLKKAWRMWSYGGWLTREARRGRFHYLSWPTIEVKLRALGFEAIAVRLSYAQQAYVVRCRKGPC